MKQFKEVDVSRAILTSYNAKLASVVSSDVAIVGAGPSGMVAAWRLAQAGRSVVVLEKRLSHGGGIWGGAMGMNEVAVQAEATSLLDDAGIRYAPSGDLFTADAMELASALCVKALHAGATMLNLMTVEDLCVHDGRVGGVVVNRTMLGEALPIDPLLMIAKVVIDATGHEAVLAQCLRRRGLLSADKFKGEGLMDAPAGEQFVVDNVTELFPGLWTTGMSVCACQGGPRMGPIFGGMLLSGVEVAKQAGKALSAGE